MKDQIRKGAKQRGHFGLTKRYIFDPTTVVDAPCETGQEWGSDDEKGPTTSFAGTSPEVFLQKVVRSDMECIVGEG